MHAGCGSDELIHCIFIGEGIVGWLRTRVVKPTNALHVITLCSFKSNVNLVITNDATID